MKEYTDVTKTCHHAEEQLVDDPRKEFNTLENNGICPSDESQGNVIYGIENRTYNSTASKAAGVEEKVNTSTDPQKSEIMRGISREETVAYHTSQEIKKKQGSNPYGINIYDSRSS